MPVDKKSQYISERRVARKLAVIAIYQWQMTQNDYPEIYLGLQEDKDLSKDMKKADMAYFQSLSKTVIENVDVIDKELNPFLDRDAEHLDQIERAVLRMATCELKNHAEVPYKVAVNEVDEVGAKLRPQESEKKETRQKKAKTTETSKVKISTAKSDSKKASTEKEKTKSSSSAKSIPNKT